MTPLHFVKSQRSSHDSLGYRRLSFEEVEWLMERGFALDHNVHGDDIISYPAWYIHKVLHPGTSWGFPDFEHAERFMEKLWRNLA